MSRQALYQNILQAQQRGLDRNVQMNQDMMTNLGKLAGGVYKFADDKREDQLKEFDKQVQQERKGYLEDRKLYGIGTDAYDAVNKSLKEYDEEMSRRRDEISNTGFMDYLGFGKDPEAPSAKLEKPDQYKGFMDPGTGARDAFQEFLPTMESGNFDVFNQGSAMAQQAADEEKQAETFKKESEGTFYNSRIGRFDKRDLRKNTDIDDEAYRLGIMAKKQNEIDSERLATVGKEEMQSRLEELFGKAGIDLSTSLTKYSAQKGIDLNFALEEIKTLEPARLTALLNKIEGLAEPEAKAKALEEELVGKARLENKKKEIRFKNEEALKHLQDVRRTELFHKKRAWNQLGKEQKEFDTDLLIKKANAVGDRDFQRRLIEYGLVEVDENGNLKTHADGSYVIDTSKDLADVMNEKELEVYEEKLNLQLDNEILRATDVQLQEASLNNHRKLKEADYKLLEDHEKRMLDSGMVDKVIAKQRRMLELEDQMAQARERRTETRDSRRRYIDEQNKIKGEIRAIKMGYMKDSLESLYGSGSGVDANGEQDGSVTMADMTQYKELLNLSDDEAEGIMKMINSQGRIAKGKRGVAMVNSLEWLSDEDKYNILKDVPVREGGLKGIKGLKFEDYRKNERIANGLIEAGETNLLSDDVLNTLGYKTDYEKKAIRTLSDLNGVARNKKKISNKIQNYLEQVKFLKPEETAARGEFARGVYKDLQSDPETAMAMEKMGIDLNSIQGMTEKKAREIAQSLASTQADLLRAKASLANASKTSSSGETPPSKMFRSLVDKFTQSGDIAPGNAEGNAKAMKDALALVRLSYPGWTPTGAVPVDGGGKTGVLAKEESQGGGEKKTDVVAETVIEEDDNQASAKKKSTGRGVGFQKDIIETASQAALKDLTPRIEANEKSALGRGLMALDSLFGEGKQTAKSKIIELSEEEGGLDNFFTKLGNKTDDEIDDYLNQKEVKGGPKIKRQITKAIRDYQDFNTNRYD